MGVGSDAVDTKCEGVIKINKKYGYGLFILNEEKTKLENMIELRLDNGGKDTNNSFIRMYKEQITSLNYAIEELEDKD